MAKQSNPTVVGGFIAGAIALTVAGIITFGSGDWFREEFRFVAYFEDSVSGLDVGAPIRYRGVQLGSVSQIKAVWQLEGEDLRIPVELTLVEGEDEVVPDGFREAYPDTVAFVEHLIVNRGLKATLRQDSFVTGKLYVALDFLPDDPILRLGSDTLPEIPTSKTGLAKLQKSLAELPIEELMDQVLTTVAAVETRLSDPKIDRALTDLGQLIADLNAQVAPLSDSAHGTMQDARALMRGINEQVGPVAGSTRDAMGDLGQLIADLNAQVAPLSDSAHGTMQDARALMRGINEQVGPVAGSTRDAMGEAEALMANFNEALGEDYTLFYRLAVLLEDMGQAARAVRALADYMERHPEALISGRSK